MNRDRDLFLVPVGGTFPVPEIERFVETLPHTFRDPKNEHVFLLSASEDLADYNRRKNLEDPDAYPSSATLIKVFPARIDVSWRRRPLEQARTFVLWMRDHYAVRIEDEEDNEVDLEALFT